MLMAGCGNKPQKEVILQVKTPILSISTKHIDKDITSMYDVLVKAGADFTKEYKDAKVKVVVTQFDNRDELKNIEQCFDKPTATDVLYSDYMNMETHIHTGRVIPLESIISQEMKADISASLWKQSQLDGKTYMLPYLYRQNILVYNKDMFKKAGLTRFISNKDEVQTWTMEEWEEILAALRQSMPKNSYPLMMMAKNWMGDAHSMCYIRSRGSSFFDAKGRVNVATPEGIAGLKWIKDCVDKGYMPEDAADMEILDNFDLFQAGQMAIYMGNLGSFYLYKCDYGMVNFPSVKGGVNTNFISGFEIYDNNDADKLAAAKAFVKYIYSSKYLDYSSGNIPASKKVLEKYAKELAPVRKFFDNAKYSVSYTGGNPNWIGVRTAFYPQMQKLLRGDKTPAEVAKLIDEACNKEIEKGYANSKLHK